MEILNVVKRWQCQWVHHTSSYMELSTCASGGAHRTNVSWSIVIATLVPLVEHIVPAPVVIVKLFGDIVLAFAVSSDCKRHGLLLEGLDSVVWLFGGRGAFELVSSGWWHRVGRC